MRVDELIKEKKLIFISNIIFIFVIFFAFILKIFSPTIFYYYCFLVIVAIFLVEEYSNFGYKYFILFSMLLNIICFIFFVFGKILLLKYFIFWTALIFLISILVFFLEFFKKYLIPIRNIEYYKKVFLPIFIILIFLIFSVLFIFNLKDDLKTNKYLKLLICSTISSFEKRFFNSDVIPLNKEEIYLSNVSENIEIFVDEPKNNSISRGLVEIEGWAIDKTSLDNSGIDNIEFFIKGEKIKETHLGSYSKNPPMETFIISNLDDFLNNEGNMSKVEFLNNLIALNLRKDVGSTFGNQFDLSGFRFNFDSNKFDNGEYIIIISAHSIFSRQNYIELHLNIKN